MMSYICNQSYLASGHSKMCMQYDANAVAVIGSAQIGGLDDRTTGCTKRVWDWIYLVLIDLL